VKCIVGDTSGAGTDDVTDDVTLRCSFEDDTLCGFSTQTGSYFTQWARMPAQFVAEAGTNIMETGK
jgi:hypothetical protein